MKMHDQSQSRKVALKLKAFIDESLEITQRKIAQIPIHKHQQILNMLEKRGIPVSSKGYLKVEMTPFMSREDIAIAKLISKTTFYRSIADDVDRYSNGTLMGDILSVPDHMGSKVLGHEGLSDAASYIFTGKKSEEVFAKTESAQIITQIKSWRDLKALTEVYSKVSERISSGSVYRPVDDILDLIKEQEASLLRKRSPDAPVRGVDFVSLKL